MIILFVKSMHALIFIAWIIMWVKDRSLWICKNSPKYLLFKGRYIIILSKPGFQNAPRLNMTYKRAMEPLALLLLLNYNSQHLILLAMPAVPIGSCNSAIQGNPISILHLLWIWRYISKHLGPLSVRFKCSCS